MSYHSFEIELTSFLLHIVIDIFHLRLFGFNYVPLIGQDLRLKTLSYYSIELASLAY